jgi:hypothetical protein
MFELLDKLCDRRPLRGARRHLLVDPVIGSLKSPTKEIGKKVASDETARVTHHDYF